MQKDIETLLASYQDPYLELDLISAKAVKQILVKEDEIVVEIQLPYPHLGVKAHLKQALKSLLSTPTQNKKIEVNITSKIDMHLGKLGNSSIPNIKNILAVASGKGGVGKSTIATNLALALAKEGAQVGLLDADIYGPNQPIMLGTKGERPFLNGKSLTPINRGGIQSMSMGYLIDENDSMMWRGPMIGKALLQLIHDTCWSALDYLIIDLPPGTGDIQLTLCQKIPINGVVIVTTPQDLALSDVRRACEMFKKLNVPILGVVENMTSYHCPQCGYQDKIFGENGAQKLVNDYGFKALGSIPLSSRIRELADKGQLSLMLESESEEANAFCLIARKVAAKLSLQPKNYSSKIPKIVVQSANSIKSDQAEGDMRTE